MSEPIAFNWVEIEGFRGFRERQHIDLDASVVIVHGPNGTGKTSFFDALQWLLLGSLKRLEQWRVRRNYEHITNRYRLSQPAVVEAEMQLGGQLVHLRRQGSYDDGLLEWRANGERVTGSEADERLRDALVSRPGQDIGRVLRTSALLQQDVVREVLEDRPAERYTQLAALLGLDDLAHFSAAAKSRSEHQKKLSAAADAALERAQARGDALAQQVQNLQAHQRLAADVQRARERIAERLQTIEGVRVREVPATSADAALLEQAARRLQRQADELFRDGTALSDQRERIEAAPTATEVDLLELAAAEAEAQAEHAAADHDAAQAALRDAEAESSKLTVLAAQALDLLGPTCPVCQQAITEAHVRAHLEARLAGEHNAGGLVERKNEEAQARAALEAARAASAAARQEFEAARLLRAAEAELGTREEAWRVAVIDFWTSGEELELIPPSLELVPGLRGLAPVSQALLAVAAGASELVAVLRSDSSDTRLRTTQAELEAATIALADAKQQAKGASAAAARAKTLFDAANKASAAVTAKRFRQLAPIVQNIFQRLDPHPSFTALDFHLDVYNRQSIASPVVRDEVADVEGDPLLVFSSSQSNVTALSYFLALGWAAGPDALPFVLLDDPLQSMDDINALGFSDLCRHIRGSRQLVVSTHEARLASLLRRKLAPRQDDQRTRVVEFRAWTRDGPEFEQSFVDSESYAGALRSVVQQAA